MPASQCTTKKLRIFSGRVLVDDGASTAVSTYVLNGVALG